MEKRQHHAYINKQRKHCVPHCIVLISFRQLFLQPISHMKSLSMSMFQYEQKWNPYTNHICKICASTLIIVSNTIKTGFWEKNTIKTEKTTTQNQIHEKDTGKPIWPKQDGRNNFHLVNVTSDAMRMFLKKIIPPFLNIWHLGQANYFILNYFMYLNELISLS